MKIALLASEGAPFIKSGGLGDVVGSLPKALAKIPGNEVVVLLPYYKQISEQFAAESVTQSTIQLGWRQQYVGIYQIPTDNVTVYFIDSLYYFGGRDGGIYGHGDDAERFAYFSKGCLEALRQLNFIPDIIHCNDWQTALVPAFLQADYRASFPYTKCVLTIHNIEYQGYALGDFFDDVLALPEEFRLRLDMGGNVNPLKGGIETADWVTTVSESYAKELLQPEYAHGLENVIYGNAHKLTGIINGIDMETMNPETDGNLPVNYNADTLTEGKALCKAALQKELGLPENPAAPLLVMVSRLVAHKGLDLLQQIAREVLEENACQMVILGTGDGYFEDFFRTLQKDFPEQVSTQIQFDTRLASRVYAGGDIYLMPSKSEPCGLSQLYAMRYGTVPVVHAVGGLADTVPGADRLGRGGSGFVFKTYDAGEFADALRRCLGLYYGRNDRFRSLQKRCMQRDFGWAKSAQQYMELFKKISVF